MKKFLSTLLSITILSSFLLVTPAHAKAFSPIDIIEDFLSAITISIHFKQDNIHQGLTCSNPNIYVTDNLDTNFDVYARKDLKFNLSSDFGFVGRKAIYYKFFLVDSVSQTNLDMEKGWKKITGNSFTLSKEGKGYLLIKYVAKNGDYEIVQTNGFILDKTPPTIRGLKTNDTFKRSKTLRFSDKISGIEKATLNNIPVEDGYQVKGKGTYTLKVYDKVGNVNAVRFSILS